MSKTSPSHYVADNGTQVIDITSQCGFVEGNAIKYLFRAGKKEGESRLDDLLKAKWYIDYALRKEGQK